MAQWTLTDNSTGTPVVLTFAVNPVATTHPGRKASISSVQSTGPNGQVIMFQGRDAVADMKIEGAVITEAFYLLLDAWKDKWYPLVLTDDEGRSWTVIFDSFTWKRVKRRNPWRFDYNASFTVIPS